MDDLCSRYKFLRFFSILLIFVLMATLLPACNGGKEPSTTPPATTSAPTSPASKTTAPTTKPPASTTPATPSGTKPAKEVSGTFSEDNLKVSDKGASLEISTVCLSEETSVIITPVDNMFINDEAPVTAYNFQIDTAEKPAGLMTITIPYDKSAIEPGMSASNDIGACYYNEVSGEWEPVSFEIDEQAGTVVITTDHLSVYGCFVVKKDFTRAAYIDYIIAPGLAGSAAQSSGLMEQVIEEALNSDMKPGPTALELGSSVVGTWLGMSRSVLITTTNLAYTSDFLQGFGNAMANVGLLSAVAQAAVDYQKGDSVALYTNLIKKLSYFAISKFGSSFLKLASVGVWCIDYALNTFATEAWTGREDIYTEAYRLYYLKESGVNRRPKDWYNILLPMAQKAQNAEELNDMIMAEIDRYCWQFWQNELIVAYYQDQASNAGFSGGGGLNQNMMDRISNRHKGELLNGYLKPVFAQIGRKLAYEQEEVLRRELMAVATELNKIITIQLYDSDYDNAKPKPEKSVWAGHIARIAPLPDEILDKEKWQQEISKDGKAPLRFRILAHIMAGCPYTIEIVSPEEPDEVIKTVTFRISSQSMDIDIGGGLPVSNISYVSSNTNSIPGNSLRAAIIAAGIISISDSGNINVEVPYATATYKSGTLNWTMEAGSFELNGTWDNTSQTGTGNVSCYITAVGIAKDSFDDDPEMKKHYVRTVYDYRLELVGTAAFSIDEDGHFVIKITSKYEPDVTSLMTNFTFINDEWKAGENPVAGYPDVLKKHYSGHTAWTFKFDIV
jgi:hypothetical protein